MRSRITRKKSPIAGVYNIEGQPLEIVHVGIKIWDCLLLK